MKVEPWRVFYGIPAVKPVERDRAQRDRSAHHGESEARRRPAEGRAELAEDARLDDAADATQDEEPGEGSGARHIDVRV